MFVAAAQSQAMLGYVSNVSMQMDKMRLAKRWRSQDSGIGEFFASIVKLSSQAWYKKLGDLCVALWFRARACFAILYHYFIYSIYRYCNVFLTHFVSGSLNLFFWFYLGFSFPLCRANVPRATITENSHIIQNTTSRVIDVPQSRLPGSSDVTSFFRFRFRKFQQQVNQLICIYFVFCIVRVLFRIPRWQVKTNIEIWRNFWLFSMIFLRSPN